MYRITSPEIYQEYQIATGTTASAAQALAFVPANDRQSVILEAVGDRIFVCFGNASVVASKTLTGNMLPPGCFSVAAGAIIQVDLPSGVNVYVSTIGTAGGGTAVIKLTNASN